MTGFVLKMIAIITMLIDHIGVIFIKYNTPEYWLFRGIGRLGFPIFVFLIVEGFQHTSNIKKYLLRLGVFAIISEMPFDIAFNHSMIEGSHQNVFFTLFLGLLCITLMDLVEKKLKNHDMIFTNVIVAYLVITSCFLAEIIKSDYRSAGVLMIVSFYVFRNKKVLQALALLIIIGALLGGSISYAAMGAMLPIFLYNGKKGKSVKYLFYIFYPAHLLVLSFVQTLI